MRRRGQQSGRQAPLHPRCHNGYLLEKYSSFFRPTVRPSVIVAASTGKRPSVLSISMRTDAWVYCWPPAFCRQKGRAKCTNHQQQWTIRGTNEDKLLCRVSAKGAELLAEDETDGLEDIALAPSVPPDNNVYLRSGGTGIDVGCVEAGRSRASPRQART